MDTLTPEERSALMRRIRSKDTTPEKIVRKLLSSMGLRYRLHRRDLPGNPDLVLAGRRTVIFVHGCFWHLHSSSRCRLARLPKSRIAFWRLKLDGNRGRDLRNQRRLRRLGWAVFVIWECELANMDRVAAKIRRFLLDS